MHVLFCLYERITPTSIRILFSPWPIASQGMPHSPHHCSSPTGASLSHRKWMKSYNFALTLTCLGSKYIFRIIQNGNNNLMKGVQFRTLYGVGLSLLMWSGRICSSCLMHRSLMSFRGGKVSLLVSSRNKCHVTIKNKTWLSSCTNCICICHANN